MFSTILIEDELLVRIGLKTSIPWEKLGFKLVGEAVDGIAGLELIHSLRPDLVLLDMKMPRMDGLTLMQKLKEENLSPLIIVISCLDDFDHTKNAMKLGAFDYILKLSMTPGDIEDVLKKARYELDSTPIPLVREQNKKDTSRVFPLLKVLDDPNYSDDSVDSFAGIPYCLLLFRLHTPLFHGSSTEQLIQSTVTEILGPDKNASYALLKPTLMYVSVHSSLSEMLSEQKLIRIAGRIVESLQEFCNIEVDIGISSITAERSHFSMLRREVEYAVRILFYLPEQRTWHYSVSTCEADVETIASAEKLFELLSLPIHTLNQEMLLTELRSFLDQCREMRHPAPRKLKSILIEMLSILDHKIQSEIQIDSQLSDDSAFENILTAPKIQILKETVLALLTERLLPLIHKALTTESAPSSHARIIREYVDQHFTEGLTLQSIAEHFRLNAAYLSHIFKQENGTGLVEYINKVRITHAKQLILKDKWRIYEVSALAGFDNVTYFNTLFKRLVGITPGEFLRRNKNS